MDIDDLFDTTRTVGNWRSGVSGEALELCEAIEARIEEMQTLPEWTKVSKALHRLGVSISASSVGNHYRNKYPQLSQRR